MTSSRLPRRFLLRCLLAFSILVCVLVPAGLFASFLVLQNYLRQPYQVVQLPVPNRVETQVTSQNAAVDDEPQPPAASARSTGVSAQIAEIVSSSQQKSTAENLSQLDAMSKQLKSVASDTSVEDLANNFEHWMGLQSRATKPTVASTLTEFDVDTAQLHDVDRREGKPGKIEYKAVLIDAMGRTVEIKLTEAEGQETFALMQRIKANPLLEKVYRRIAMPILDSLVQSARDQLKSQSPSPASSAGGR